MRRNFFILFAISIFCCIFGASCSSCCEASDTSSNTNNPVTFTITNWNTQTFFDGNNDGIEYSEFRSGGKWDWEKYSVRLSRLCSVLETIGSDIFVLEELENEKILQDIANQFAGKAWNQKQNWSYACFSKENGSSIGIGILSKFPLISMTSHFLDIRTQTTKQPSSRPVLEVLADVNGREVVIFANHWKSKSGGQEETEIWRDWQESLLASRLLQLSDDACAVICGDFNRDASDFIRKEENGCKILLRNADFSSGKRIIELKCPWFTSEGKYISETGSYYYKNSWERIDHIFCFGKITMKSFGPDGRCPWADENHIPQGYSLYSGQGYSDHLPVTGIFCTN